MDLAEALQVIAPMTHPDPSVNERRKMAFDVVYEALRSPKITKWFAKDQGNRWEQQIDDVINGVAVNLLTRGPRSGDPIRNGEAFLFEIIERFIIDTARKKKYSFGGKKIAKEGTFDVAELDERQRLSGTFQLPTSRGKQKSVSGKTGEHEVVVVEDPLSNKLYTDPARLEKAAQQLQRTKEFLTVVIVPGIARTLRQDGARNFKIYIGYLMCGNTVEEIAEKEFGQPDLKSKNAVYKQLSRQRQKLFENTDAIFRAARDHGIWEKAIVQVMEGFRARGAG